MFLASEAIRELSLVDYWPLVAMAVTGIIAAVTVQVTVRGHGKVLDRLETEMKSSTLSTAVLGEKVERVAEVQREVHDKLDAQGARIEQLGGQVTALAMTLGDARPGGRRAYDVYAGPAPEQRHESPPSAGGLR